MRLLKTGVIVFAVVFISLALFFSCDDGTKAVDPTEADIQKFVEVMQLFGPYMGPEPPPCVDVSYSETQISMTFTNCESDGVIINGSMTLTISLVSEDQGSLTFTGTLNLSGAGAPVSSITFDFTLTFDTSSYPYSFAMSGTITIDGTVFDASGFLNEFLFYYW